ncbi:hypothetical protein [Streptomyces sp. NPDC049879]|uniref:hypothetical protein n=1 Tax=Streptomyces sp. NPDC049879 TaxID=3365598 RepID=UPI00379CD32F
MTTTTKKPPAAARDELVAALEAALDAARGVSLDAFDNAPLRDRLDAATLAADGARCVLSGVLVSRLDPACGALGHLTKAGSGLVRQAAVALEPLAGDLAARPHPVTAS